MLVPLLVLVLAGIYLETGSTCRQISDRGNGVCPDPDVCLNARITTAIQDGAVSYYDIK